MENNTGLWDKFKHTDPQFTKNFRKSGRSLTTVDSMYQILQMTREFGPVGKGWTYDASYTYTDRHVFAEVKISYCIDDKWYHYGPISSAAELYIARKNAEGTLKFTDFLDDSASKKALTDALTKGLSHLGMSADVFLGLFDNNLYVEEMKTKFNNGNANEKPKTTSYTLKAPKDNADDFDFTPSQASNAATEKQLATMEKCGIDFDPSNPPSKQEASRLIGEKLGVTR